MTDVASANTDERGSEALERDQLINAVRAREQFLEGILGSLESFGTIDGDWRITFVNEAAARLAGVSQADLLGTDIRALASAGVKDQFAPPLVRAMTERVTVEFDVADSGEQRLYRGKAYPLDDGGLAIYVRDVTEHVHAEQARAEAEQALQKEHARLQAIIATIPVGFLIIDADGQVAVENDAAKRIWRGSVSLDGVSDLARRKAFWPESGERLGSEDWPGVQALRHGRRIESLELDIERLDGTRGTCLSSAAPIQDAEGAIIGAVVAFQDISERKETDAALRENEQLLRTVLDHSRDGINMLDLATGKYVFMNAAQVGLTGFTTEELNGITAEEAYARVHPDDRELSIAQQQRVAAGEDLDEPVEYRWRVKDGEYRWFSDRRKIVRDEAGEPVGLVGISRDITENKLIEEALRESVAEKAAQRERNRLARELHDSVTQALFAATIKAEALTLDDSLSPVTTEAVEDVRRLTRGALAQMRTLLLELRAEPLEQIPVRQLLRHLVEATESRTSAGVRLTVRDEAALPRALHAPVYRIVQEALNNVARHARAANAWVALDVRPSGVRLVIGDDGRGFDPDAVGAGHLGLRSMRERAAEAGAELRVTASPGHGTEIVAQWSELP